MSKAPMETNDSTGFITQLEFQKYLDDNKRLIETIMESRKEGDFSESDPYMDELQSNLIYLTKSIEDFESRAGKVTPSSELSRELERIISSDVPTPNNNDLAEPAPPAESMDSKTDEPSNPNSPQTQHQG